MDITPWMVWFLETLRSTLNRSSTELEGVRERAAFWERAGRLPLHSRQKKMITLLLEGFQGNMTSSKWAALCKCSQDTAGRDIAALIGCGLLKKGLSGGRSTWYALSR